MREQGRLQRLFERMARHMLTQGRRSISSNGRCCFYRHPDGRLRCPVGALISDSRYKPYFDRDGEGLGPPGVLTDPEIQWAAGLKGSAEVELADAFQSLHDGREPADWRKGIREIAIKFNLDDSLLTRMRKAVV